MRSVPGQEHATLAIRRRLFRAVTPGRTHLDRVDRHVGAGHAPQHRLHVRGSELGAVGSAAVEVGHHDPARLPLRVHTATGMMATPTGKREGSPSSTSTEYPVSSGSVPTKSNPPCLRTVLRPPSQPTSQPARKVSFPAWDSHVIVAVLEAGHTLTTPDLDADRDRVGGEDVLEMLHLDPEVCVARSGNSVAPARRLDVRVVELNAGKMSSRAAWFPDGGGGRGRRLSWPALATPGRDRFKNAAPVERLDARAPQSSQTEGESLER